MSAWSLAELSRRSPVLYWSRWPYSHWLQSSKWNPGAAGFFLPRNHWSWFLGYFPILPHTSTSCLLARVCFWWPLFLDDLFLQESNAHGSSILLALAGLTPLQWECSWSVTLQVLAEQTAFLPALQQLLCQSLTSRRRWAQKDVFSTNRTNSKAN